MQGKTVNIGRAAILAVGVWAAVAGAALAQTSSRLPPSPFAATPFGARAPAGQPGAPAVARYVAGNASFILDTSGPVPLMRYSNSGEIFALRPQPAPRGDTLFLNDAGEAVLRATRLGGLTAFTASRPEGSAAALSGPGAPLGLPDIRSAAQLTLRIFQSSERISRLSGREIGMSALDLSGPEVFPLLADTVSVTVEAFTKVNDPKYVVRKKTWVQALGVVKFVEGEPPRAYVDKDALVVVITPSRGVAGRPSSLRIVKALTR